LSLSSMPRTMRMAWVVGSASPINAPTQACLEGENDRSGDDSLVPQVTG
jgi:hypothetical protein